MEHIIRIIKAIYPQLATLATNIPHYSIPIRKVILTCARCQRVPILSESLSLDPLDAMGRHITIEELLSTVPSINSPSGFSTLYDILSSHRPFFESVSYSGLISMLVRNIPYEGEAKRSVRDTIEKAIEKEIKAATGIFHPTSFNWDAILFPSTNNPIHPDYPYDPNFYLTMNRAMVSVREKLKNRVIYPRLSNKTFGRNGTRNFDSIVTEEEGLSMKENTTTGLERLYVMRGVKVAGETEVRHAFKYGDLGPRVYYAMGPDQFYSSKFIQPIFNSIVDGFSSVSRKNRYILANIHLVDSMTVMIYDYSSFTSTLHEITNFVYALARFFKGTEVVLMDGRHGPTRVDLGDLIHDFNLNCQDQPSFDLSRIEEYLDSTHLPADTIHVHNCGMLGVPGNIQSCTLLHGFHLACLLLSMEMIRCVGDDAVAVFDGNVDRERFLRQLQNIGLVSMVKTEWWDVANQDVLAERGEDHLSSWHYTKRPFNIIAQHIVLGQTPIFPPIGLITNSRDADHTISQIPDTMAMIRAIRMMQSFAFQFVDLTVSEEDEDVANKFLTVVRIFLYSKYTSDKQGRITHLLRSLRMMPTKVGKEGVEEVMFNARTGRSGLLLPVVHIPEEDPHIETGFSVRLEMSAALSYGRKMGWVESERVLERCFGQEAADRLYDVLFNSRSLAFSYDVSFTHLCPEWFLSHVKHGINPEDVPFNFDEDEEDALDDVDLLVHLFE